MSRPSDVRLALHGPSAACHELHGGAGEAFVGVLERLREARTAGRRALVATWLTRSNCRSLVALCDLLVGYGVGGWVVVWPRVDAGEVVPVVRRPDSGSVPEMDSGMVPRLGIAVPHALRAVQRAMQRRLPTLVVGVPACTLGPFAAQGRVGVKAGAYPDACEGCPSRAGCGGVDRWYLERFGVQELRAVPAVPRASLPEALEEGLRLAADELGAVR
ncbi:hypothetical protein [Paraliomyxa miuraensis]|uniref:hypothetical protein n=1 Tax=Paraliomyxa miuraensis TaxID=376150 RepID=UPI002251FAA9|nr:hypothetical protein [Paraliomyxa miuraensis]MCX4239802.1 hypothetical protein [Paraliomyxa miuraensis]